MRVIYIYKWATLGGVERVILNRTHVLKDIDAGWQTFIYFMFDVGGGGKIKDYIKQNSLNSTLRVVEEFNPEEYDIIISIDTPEIFSSVETHPNVLFECHTAYADNREYLKKLPIFVKQLLVPSEIFKSVLLKEYPGLAKKIKVLDNFIYRFPSASHLLPDLFENKIPLLSIGRLDELKNPLEIIKITSLLKRTFGDRFILFLVGADYMGLERVFSFAAEHGLAGRIIYLPHIAFTKTHEFFMLMKKNRGVYISASTGETFGMAVAEAMTYGLPVLLSDIEAHKRLCDNDHRLLYKLKNIDEAALKLGDIIKNWDAHNQLSEKLSCKFDSASFLKQWTTLIKSLEVTTNQSA